MNIRSITLTPFAKRFIVGTIGVITGIGVVSVLRSCNMRQEDLRTYVGVGAFCVTFFDLVITVSCISLNFIGLMMYKYGRSPEKGTELLNRMSFFNNNVFRFTAVFCVSLTISLLVLGEKIH